MVVLERPITGSTAARRRISRRLALVTLARTNLSRPAAVALVGVDAADRNACEHLEIGDDPIERVAVVGVAVQRFGVQHELPALGRP